MATVYETLVKKLAEVATLFLALEAGSLDPSREASIKSKRNGAISTTVIYVRDCKTQGAASQVVDALVSYMRTCSPGHRAPALFVVDAVLKGTAKEDQTYLTLFRPYLADLTARAYEGSVAGTKTKILQMIENTWIRSGFIAADEFDRLRQRLLRADSGVSGADGGGRPAAAPPAAALVGMKRPLADGAPSAASAGPNSALQAQKRRLGLGGAAPAPASAPAAPSAHRFALLSQDHDDVPPPMETFLPAVPPPPQQQHAAPPYLMPTTAAAPYLYPQHAAAAAPPQPQQDPYGGGYDGYDGYDPSEAPYAAPPMQPRPQQPAPPPPRAAVVIKPSPYSAPHRVEYPQQPPPPPPPAAAAPYPPPPPPAGYRQADAAYPPPPPRRAAAKPTAADAIDADELWASLVGSGLVGPEGGAGAAGGAPAVGAGFTADFLRKPHDFAVSDLLRATRKNESRWYDAEFLRRQRDVLLGGQGGGSRQWYVPQDQWLLAVTPQDAGGAGPGGAGDAEDDDPRAVLKGARFSEAVEDPSIRFCALSGEPFEAVFDDATHQWRYVDCVRLRGEHAARYGLPDGSYVLVSCIGERDILEDLVSGRVPAGAGEEGGGGAKFKEAEEGGHAGAAAGAAAAAEGERPPAGFGGVKGDPEDLEGGLGGGMEAAEGDGGGSDGDGGAGEPAADADAEYDPDADPA